MSSWVFKIDEQKNYVNIKVFYYYYYCSVSHILLVWFNDPWDYICVHSNALGICDLKIW